MMTWLPGVEIIRSDRARGGTYVTDLDVPWRFVAHTTEAVPSSLDGARAMAGRHEFPPHLWAWPERDWVGQTVPLDRSAFALYHASTDPHTNKMKALQVEIIGRAVDSPNHPDEHWAWIGRRVLRPIVDAGYPINLHLVAPTTGKDGYGEEGRVRMSWAAWRNFSGVCGHANVPGNSHWDIGAGRLDLIANAALDQEDDDMPTAQEIAAAVWGHKVFTTGDPQPATIVMRDIMHHARVAAGNDDVDEVAIVEALFTRLAERDLSSTQVQTIIAAMPAAVKQALRQGTDPS